MSHVDALIDQDTTFIVQGITGREAVNLTRECLDYGSKIVGGVTPGRKGREVHGVPVFDTVAQASSTTAARARRLGRHRPPRLHAATPSSRRSHTGIKLIVIVTERIPRRDVAEMVELADAKGARIIGPNCLGVIVPGVARWAASAARPQRRRGLRSPARSA